MHIYIFMSQSDPAILAFTSTEDGSNIPADHGPWQPSGSGRAIPVGMAAEPMMEAVRKDGYFIVSDRSTH